MIKGYDVSDSPYDEIVNRLLSGKISPEEAEKLTTEKLSVRKRLREKESLGELNSEIRDGLTGASLRYCFDGEEGLYIIKTKSKRENQGGFSMLLSQLEKIAKEKGIPSITLDVYEKKTQPREIYLHKGFKEINRAYMSEEEDFLITMRKGLI
jgi:GNAT superfamily N-acetyltransferase